MPDNQAKVLIELQLEMKKLKSQLKSVSKEFKNFKKEIDKIGDAQASATEDQLDGLKKIESAQKKGTAAWTRGEKQKAKATKDSAKALKDQEKELGRIAKMWKKLKDSGMGKFAGGFAAGSGMAGMGQGMGSMRGLGGKAGRLVSRGVGGLVGFGVSGATNAYQTYMQYGMARAGLTGLGRPSDLRKGGKGAGNLGYTPTETVGQAVGVGRATGNIGAVYQAQSFARGYGMDVGEATGHMGMIRQAGFGFGGQTRQGPAGTGGTRELTKIIEAGMISGLEKGRIGEFLQGVSSITGQLGSQLPGRINVGGIAAQAAMLGQSKLPGFQGARGMQLLARLNQSIQKPGGGEAGQSMMMQALGFGKPGGGTRYYQALKMQEEGINDPRNLPKLMKEVYSQLGDPSKGGRAMVNEEANLAMKEISGLSLKQVEELQTIMASGKSAEEQQKEIKALMKSAESIEEQALKTSKEGFTGVAKHVAGVEAKQISIGATFAPIFMKIQNFQLEALKTMASYLPQVIKWLKELYERIAFLVDMVAKFVYSKDKAGLAKAERAHDKKIEEIMGVRAKTIGGRQLQYLEQIALREKRIKDLEKDKGARLAEVAREQESRPMWRKILIPNEKAIEEHKTKQAYAHASAMEEVKTNIAKQQSKSLTAATRALRLDPANAGATPLTPSGQKYLERASRSLRTGESTGLSGAQQLSAGEKIRSGAPNPGRQQKTVHTVPIRKH